MDKFFQDHAQDEVTTILHEGMPWGALEELRRGDKLKDGLSFSFPEETMDEVQPWIELINNGTFQQDTLSKLPQSYQVSDEWVAILQQSADKFGSTWLHDLHLAIALTEAGEVDRPLKLLKRSLKSKMNPLSLRNIAVLQPSYEEAWPIYQHTWEVLNSPDYEWINDEMYPHFILNLATEMSFFLQTVNWVDEMVWWIETLENQNYPTSDIKTEIMGLDAVLTTQTRVLLQENDYSSTLDILSSNCYPTYGRARSDLIDMWNEAVEREFANELKIDYSELTKVQSHQARVNKMPPRNIGCPYADLWCMNYW